jgi:hypothetical protein
MSSLFSLCDWVGPRCSCRPCFRFAIGLALSAFVVPVFALRLGRLTDGLQSLLIFVVLDVWGWVMAVFAGLGLDRLQFGCLAGVD